MLQTMNSYLQKAMPFITPSAVAIGVLLAESLHTYVYLVPWIFAFMTFSGSLSSNFSDFKKVLQHPLAMITCLIVLHVSMPLLALGIGSLVFNDEPYLVIGLILAFLIPTGITSLIWVSMYKGNVALTLSIILIDTLLSPLIVPFFLQFFVGTAVEMNEIEMMKGLLWMIVLPSLAGMILNQATKGRVKETLGVKLAPFSKIGLGFVVAVNSSTAAPYFKNINGQFILVASLVLLIAIIGYMSGWLAAKLLKADNSSTVSLIYNSGMRNISAGAVIAIAYFPPLVSLPVIIGMLFQQVLAAFSGYLLEKYYASSETRSVIRKRA
ncbi:bile acid:sodium symporter family protein [Bacillus taeanensis]|uniref:Bile acid:sodium symporter family protein n=1 Tax=Bacillus taeanensis TaxID=273032 RepID=A0A366XSE5_9BACI|nr:bile acid:sodium symporter family protein [Bacillus taeanensis]RBW67679.1 bile acid:sodium symporter family protein [Bacillus taeanensis]